MTVIFGNVTIECTPEEFKRLVELGVVTAAGVQTPDNKDFPPYLDLPKK